MALLRYVMGKTEKSKVPGYKMMHLMSRKGDNGMVCNNQEGAME